MSRALLRSVEAASCTLSRALSLSRARALSLSLSHILIISVTGTASSVMVLPGLIVVIFLFQGFASYHFAVTGDELRSISA